MGEGILAALIAEGGRQLGITALAATHKAVGVASHYLAVTLEQQRRMRESSDETMARHADEDQDFFRRLAQVRNTP